jgi:flavin reductase (DIM6/NTAB) family NADH-FMN oxidoreductase RutF
MFSANQTPEATRKDSVVNAEATRVFCWNMATWELRHAVNVTAEQVPYGVDEFARAGLETTDSVVVAVGVGVESKSVPMVRRSPVRFECEYHSTLKLPGNPPMGSVDVVIGKVVGIHIDEGVLTDGRIDVRKTRPIARCGYAEYAVVSETFEMRIPGGGATGSVGLEGSVSGNRKLGREMAEEVNEKGAKEDEGG